jgi:tetratricopeptide (TPR) repeat protein
LAHFYYGFARTHRGLFAEAMESLERAAAACDRGDVFMLKPWLDGLIAFSHARCGRHRLARILFERSISRARQLQLVVFEAMAIAGLAVAVFMDHGLAEAEELAHQALRLAEDNGYRGVEMWLNRVLGLIGVAQGGSGWERGEQRFLRAVAIGQELGMNPDIALCRLFLGRHYAMCGRKDEAVRQLKESEALLRDMKMDFWLPHVREVVGEGGPSHSGVDAQVA